MIWEDWGYYMGGLGLLYGRTGNIIREDWGVILWEDGVII
jgi:hypothetical protein